MFSPGFSDKDGPLLFHQTSPAIYGSPECNFRAQRTGNRILSTRICEDPYGVKFHFPVKILRFEEIISGFARLLKPSSDVDRVDRLLLLDQPKSSRY